jgi:hypothetical protein
MAKKTSIYLSDEMERAVAASGLSLIDLVRAGLEPLARRDRLADEVGELVRMLREGCTIVPRDPA